MSNKWIIYVYSVFILFVLLMELSTFPREAIEHFFFFALEIKLTNFRVFIKREIENLKTTTINKQNNNLQEFKEQIIKGILLIILFSYGRLQEITLNSFRYYVDRK